MSAVREMLDPARDAHHRPWEAGWVPAVGGDGREYRVRVQTLPGDEFGMPMRKRWVEGDPYESLVFRVRTVETTAPADPRCRDWSGDFRTAEGAALFAEAVIDAIARSAA